jgi:hypothetical protein
VRIICKLRIIFCPKSASADFGQFNFLIEICPKTASNKENPQMRRQPCPEKVQKFCYTLIKQTKSGEDHVRKQ